MDEQRMAALRDTLTSGAHAVTTARIAEAVRAEGLALGSATAAQVVKSLRDELVGLGPLQQFAEAPSVTDVLLDGQGSIWTDGEAGLCRREVSVEGEDQRRALARRLIAMSGGRLDEGHPCADGRIGPYRIHAVIPPIAVEGTVISVRVSRGSSAELTELAQQWDDPPRWLQAIHSMVNGSLNCLISGATGSGKTSLLTAMIAAAPETERIIVVEDTTEILPSHPHVVHLQGRQGNVEGAGRVEMGALVRQTLRMRPDRLIVGECRGAELRDFLAAMNTGHQGAIGTVHANSAAAVPARLVAMGALAGMSPEAVGVQAAAALDAVIHVERRAGRRMPVGLSWVTYRDERLHLENALSMHDHRAVEGPGWHQPWWQEMLS